MVIKHLYQRTIEHKGKKVKAWYFWYYDNNKKQVRKSCGQRGNPCLIKRDAERYIASISDEDLGIVDFRTITFNQFCSKFYDENSTFVTKQKNRGNEYAPNTLYGKKHYLQYFLEKFGEMPVDQVDGSDIENWILSLPYCISVKNHILKMCEEIYKELYSYHLIKTVPLFERYKRNDTKEKGILTPDEIKMLFPDDYEQLIKVWDLRGSKLTDRDNYTFATMIFTILSTGLRSSEVRALQWDQFIDNQILLINAMVNSEGDRVDKLKKGTKENKKWRAAVLPDRTAKMISDLKLLGNYSDNRMFVINNEEVTTFYLLDHFKLIMEKHGINHKERNITVHSLRFTYNTLMMPQIDENDLRYMIGHVSKVMTDYYDMSKIKDKIPGLLKNKEIINDVWN